MLEAARAARSKVGTTINLAVLVMITRDCQAMEMSPTVTTLATLGHGLLVTLDQDRADAMEDAPGATLLCRMGGARWMMNTATHHGTILGRPTTGLWRTPTGISARPALQEEGGNHAGQLVNGVVAVLNVLSTSDIKQAPTQHMCVQLAWRTETMMKYLVVAALAILALAGRLWLGGTMLDNECIMLDRRQVAVTLTMKGQDQDQDLGKEPTELRCGELRMERTLCSLKQAMK